MTRQRVVRSRRYRTLMLATAISVALVEQAHAGSSPFARRGLDPSAQAAQTVQQQTVQNSMATQLSQQSLQAFQRAAQARSALDAAQAAARAAAAAAASDIPDGLGQGGLQVANGVVVDTGAINPGDPRLGQDNIWLGAQLPTQTTSNGQTHVTIQQTQQKAILNWQTFNVGKNTQLTFDQSAGGANATQWIALNRVNDPNAAPSMILGSIKAQGQVYVLDRNGVIFGGASQVNTHSLLVSSLDLFTSNLATSNSTFITQGLFGNPNGNAPILTGVDAVNAGATPGAITVQAGAQIASGPDGYTLIAAPNISNAGSISAVDGQVMLAAVLGLRQGQVVSTVNSNRLPVSFDGFQVGFNTDLSGIGKLENTGLVSSMRGDATLVGYDLLQHGIVTATTSISRPGSVSLLAIDQSADNQDGSPGGMNIYYGGLLDLGSGSITSVLPDEDGETTTSSAAANAAFVGPTMNIAGAEVGFDSDSMVFAPGATLNIAGWSSNPRTPTGREEFVDRIWMDPRSLINVAGLPDVQLSMSDNLITIPRVGQNELSNSPLQRDGILYKNTLVFDRRDTGTRDDGLAWVGSPLLDVQGYVDQVPRTIDQMLVNGGTVNVSGHDFVMNPGSSIDLDGGYLHFAGGMVETQRLVGSNGRLYDLADADPSITYTGFAGQQTVDHSRWGVTQAYNSPMLGVSLHYESNYLEGGNGGSLNINLGENPSVTDPTSNLGALVLAGDLSAQAVSGRYQILDGDPAQGGSLNLDTNAAELTTFTALTTLEQRSWQITTDSAQVPDGLGIDTPVTSLPAGQLPPTDQTNPGFWSTLSTDQIAKGGFSQVSIGHAALVDSDAASHLQVADGGTIAITAGGIDLQGSMTAHAGTISLTSLGGEVLVKQPPLLPGQQLSFVDVGRGNLVLGSDARLDVSGNWVNDSDQLTDQVTGTAYINGGNISLATRQATVIGADGNTYDDTGSILLAPGSVLDASSGGYVNARGKLATVNGVPLGRGGNISLQTYLEPPTDTTRLQTYVVDHPVVDDQTGLLDFQGAELIDNSFAGGGTLTLRALGVQIGGDAPTDPRILFLDPSFFDTQGFGGYNLAAELDATIAAGTQVHVSQLNLLPDIQALQGAATGTDIFAGLGSSGSNGPGSNGYVSIGQLDPFHRAPTNFSLSAGDYLGRFTGNPTLIPATGTLLLDEGASLDLDPGANVRLGSRGQVTILGDVTDHGGNIVLSGDSSEQSGLSPANPNDKRSWFDPTKSVWVGSDAVLDVSGISLIDPLAPMQATGQGQVQPRTGKVLDGGSITLTNDTGYVVVQDGAQFDLSGAQDTYDLPTGTSQLANGAVTLQSTPVWSNGGTLTLAASAGLYFDGSIHAAGGAPQAEDGTLVLLPLATPANGIFFRGVAANGIIFTQSDTRMPDGLTPGSIVESGSPNPSGKLYFAADLLDGSGIGTLVVGNQAPIGDGLEPPLVPIGFSGNVDLSLSRALILNAPLYAMLPDGATNFTTLGTDNQVQLNAPYVALDGFRPSDTHVVLPKLAAPGATTLDVNADFIDIGGQIALAGVGDAKFDSSGDIRFHTPAAFAFEDLDTPVARHGELLTAGNLEFQASQLYPESGETFGVLALGAIDPLSGLRADTSITVTGNGNSSIPLSAGGTLALDATNITQDGTIRAPSGSIVLGVSDPTDAAAQALFGGSPLVQTQNVQLGAGSLTSVSLDGAVLPYGTTVDGTEWQYNADPYGNNQDVTAAPQKRIELGGANVTLAAGATVDLSGSGDLQAVEWVPGTGGTRNVLSQYNTVYSGGSTAQQVPLYQDGRGVYAIVPGAQTPVAASDPVFDQGASQVAVGQSVYLSGVPGLPAGVYTLMPAMYATLPGAYRVVVNSGSQDATPAENFIAPDGTAVVSGYYVDALTGARGARSELFDVQSRSVWGQYSQFNTTSGNSFFTALAARQGDAIPQRSMDAGQLVLAATEQLGLGATLETSAATGGSGAEVDIASKDIQVLDGDHPALDGYVQLNVSDLDNLNAGSLLIGGIRQQTAQGTQIDVLADSVVVSNDAAHPLQAPEILMVAGAGRDPNDGLHIGAGSVIAAQGDASANKLSPILIGSAPGANGQGGISGDGALLRVSNAGDAPLIRSDVPAFGSSQAILSVGDGAQLLGGASLTLDSTGDTQVPADAVLQGKSITADAGNVRFVSGTTDSGGDGLVIGDDSLARFAGSDSVTLRSYGTMDFVGNVDLQVGNALTLSAGSFTSDGGTVDLGAKTLTLSNDLGGASAPGVVGTGSLNLQGQDVVFGDGNKALSGFGSVSVDASDAVVVQGKGDFDFGSLDVSLKAPAIEAASGAENILQTTGTLTLLRGDGTAAPASALGGSITLQGGSIDSDALILAASGSVELHATSGDVDLHDGARIDVGGVAKPFFDVTAYSQGGDIALVSDRGDVNTTAGTALDFGAQAGGGDAGALTVSAIDGNANLLGTLDGAAAKGVGGSLALDVGSTVDLDALSRTLAASGIDDAIAVHTRSGNLVLSAGSTLKGNDVSLTADGDAGSQQRDPDNGNILVGGTIDASGDAGGDISLWGRNGVELDGSLLAKGSDPDQRGGSIVIGTSGNSDGTLNANYGYENVQGADAGVITLGNGAVIDVSGGSAGGLSGGTVDFRAPLLVNGDVNVDIANGATITGARDVGVEAYAVWSTTDAGTDPSKHFDGFIDPAGWYNAQGQLMAGTWTDRNGIALPPPTTPAQVADYLAKYVFTPNHVDKAHGQFYGYANDNTHAPGTLMGFVQDPGFAFESRFADIANFHARAGIELRNPDANDNGGAITVLTGWNLASGSSQDNLDFRYHGNAPVLTLRAAGDVNIDASISDGFFQTLNPFTTGSTVNTPALVASLSDPLPLATDSLIGGDSTSFRIVAGADFDATSPDAVVAGGDGDVILNGHLDYQQAKKKDVLQPTTVRTGTGSIDIEAARDLHFADPLAPASIYTAGAPAAGTSYDTGALVKRGGGTNPDIIVGAQANAEGAGDITLDAGRDIVDNQELFDPDGSISKVVGNYIAQYWWPWMQVGNVLDADGTVVAAPINFGGFAQGVLSAGGNVNIDAGRDIRELSVSLPVSWTMDGDDKTQYGGGNLVVRAGHDVLGGDYFVAKGSGTLEAGGDIGSAFTLDGKGSDAVGEGRNIETPVDPIIALQDAQWTIEARGDAAIGAIVNPSYQVTSEQSGTLVPVRATLDYSTDSSVAVSSLYGDVQLNTLALPGELFDYGQLNASHKVSVSDLGFDDVLPASLSAVSFGGDLSVQRSGRMFPSATGELSLLADDSIDLYDDSAVQGLSQENALQMLDAPGNYDGNDTMASADQQLNLHRDDTQPVYVYALNGDIVGGFASGGFMLNPLTLILPKPAQIRAGRDIVNLDLRGQNYFASDITSVIAGRDLYYTPIAGAPDDPEFATRWTWLQLGGPGTFVVQAGRNLGPLTSANEALDANLGAPIDGDDGGIRTIGNRDNLGLSDHGATIDARYGVSPGVATDAFVSAYIDPSAADTTATYGQWLTAFVLQYENDQRTRAGETALPSLSTSDAWVMFQQLPEAQQQLLVDRVFFDVLERTGANAVDPGSPDFGQYARGYQAVQTLFPADLGYTANNLEGGANGAATQVSTGEFDMRGSTVQTERGGDIRILGPGGNLLVGSISAPPTVVDQLGNVLIGPNQQGILALGVGEIGIFSDASVLLAQSRIFTERGGDLTIWSSNGDVNAGKGAKTSSDQPPISYLCDRDHYCNVDARGQVSGAGIATLQTIPGDADGNAVLVAPRGTVDAGDAGIRVAGNLVVASEFVANADNIDVKGNSVGVSGAHGVDAGTLNAASSAASSVADAAGNLAGQRQEPLRDMPSIISVQVIGFGECAPTDSRCKKRL
ncbi:MAG TPA: filamentous hemagglutinin family protein [Xanthomonadaceae bacterium]|jgi:filamentous hemagglutinin family protein